MRTTIDSAGRILVPKSLRQALNIKPGQTLEIRAGDGRIEIEIATATAQSTSLITCDRRAALVYESYGLRATFIG